MACCRLCGDKLTFLALHETQALAALLFVALAELLGSGDAARFFEDDASGEVALPSPSDCPDSMLDVERALLI